MKLDAMIDKSLPLEAQIIQAQKLQQELMEGAVAALYDPELGVILREAFARPSIEKLKAEVGGSGEPELQAILDKLTAPDTLRKWFEPGACFAAGTLVHTKEGLVPIEQIKVGDWVLSKPENGGAQAYKQVVQTFVHPPQRVVSLGYYIPAKKPDPYGGNVGVINCTLHHPFWVKEMGWTAVSELDGLGDNSVHFEDLDGEDIPFSDVKKIYISDQPNVGWMSAYDNDTEASGALWDFANNRLLAQGVFALDEIGYHQVPYDDPQFGTFPEELYLHLPVYNLEVEDFHTYYVGEHGIWVHNTNCGGLSLEAFRVFNTP